jgi:hypothetical protein
VLEETYPTSPGAVSTPLPLLPCPSSVFFSSIRLRSANTGGAATSIVASGAAAAYRAVVDTMDMGTTWTAAASSPS